ncbi:MAG TPA: class I SAM-dependent methyltransferase [Acidobacteriota bacterium]|nr:class I SAM-dependent methyltransferase [Acidobacteriota bacterium]HQF86809.1 class I SAM-dependent methyltransferase [Acidobacteriota bacterium]HQG91393.1 class I SAM-dependent methyltransferase [Acidobacteriota bacterium]HQK87502.1 class I SAM-dependent methyltransferase [Acidobacteriota bacterium]
MTVFNEFSTIYDRMFPWETRLAKEGPFLRRLFEGAGVQTVLDCACGTGRHVIALSQWGYQACGSDQSPRMIEAARANARAAGVAADFRTASFTGLDAAFGPAAAFDAVLCIGNSLTLAPSDDDVAAAWRAMHRVLRPGGIAVVHVFNWDRVAAAGLKITPAIIVELDGRPVTTLRVFHHHESVIDLHLVTVSRADDGRADTQVLTAAQRPLGPDSLAGMAAAAGFEEAARWNGYDGRPFDPGQSDQLLLVARKPSMPA